MYRKTDYNIFQLPPSPLLSQGENIEFCDETTVEHLDCAGKHSKAFDFEGKPLLANMTSLLTHNVAHSTRHSFRPRTNNQPIKKFLSLAFS